MLTMRQVTKATELKRFKELEGEYHYFYVPNGRPKAVWAKPLCKDALVNSDALHCQQDTAREILCSGGEHLMQVKGNQAGIVAKAGAIVKARHRVGPKKQAYGYRDFKYFRLKIFDLPNLKPRDSDC